MAFRTLTNLPAELLHIILSHLARNKRARDVQSCSLVCHLLRAVAFEHLDVRYLSLKDVTSIDHLLHFLRRHPRVARNIVCLCLQGAKQNYTNYHRPITTIDDTLVASVMELLPKLESLQLYSFRYIMPMTQDVERRTAGPFSLSKLIMDGYEHPDSSLTGALRVLSLFTTKSMVRLDWATFDLNAPFEPDRLHRSLDIGQLDVSGSNHGCKYTAMLFEAVAVSLKSDSLRVLHVQVDSQEAVHALGKMLGRAGCNITTLVISNNGRHSQSSWVDPLEGNWKLLNILACKKLEHIELPMHFRENSVGPLSDAPAGILQQAPSTLRKVSIHVYNLQKSTTIGNRTVFKIHVLDKLLSPTRFPNLQECELKIDPDRRLRRKKNYWPKCVDSARRALKSLDGRGLLKITDPSPFAQEPSGHTWPMSYRW